MAAWPGVTARAPTCSVLVQEARLAPCAHRADGRCTARSSGIPAREKAATRRVGIVRAHTGRDSCPVSAVLMALNAETGGAVARPLVLHVVFSVRPMEAQNKVLG